MDYIKLREKVEKAIQDQQHLPGAEEVMIKLINEFETQKETLELSLSYARDIVQAWPTLTMRGLGAMTNKVNALREALELIK